jgi:hypothetical protein
METNMSYNDWAELIHKHNVIQKLNNGEKFSSVNIDLGLDPNSDALRKALKRLGYKKDKYQGLYYIEGYTEQEEAVQLLNTIDVEETIEEIAADRYYKALTDDFWGGETVSVQIDKEIYQEYLELSEQFGCDLEDEFMTMVLLEGLEKYKPVDRRREHYIKYMNESQYFSKEEIEFIMQKEKEGYDLESLVLATEDYDILKLTPAELEEYKRK